MSKLTDKHFARLSAIHTSCDNNMNGYTYESAVKKDDFHKTAKLALRNLAKDLGLSKGEFNVRSNKAGPAVGGEITLHTDTMYITISGSDLFGNRCVIYRRCNGRGDYIGQTNNWCSILEAQERIRSFARVNA